MFCLASTHVEMTEFEVWSNFTDQTFYVYKLIFKFFKLQSCYDLETVLLRKEFVWVGAIFLFPWSRQKLIFVLKISRKLRDQVDDIT